MPLLTELSDVIGNIYSSVTEPDLLPQTYDEIARLLGGVGAVVIPVEPNPEFPPYVSGNLIEAMKEYDKVWWSRDPGVIAARELGNPLGVFATEDIVDAETMVNDPHYTDFSTRHGFRYFLSMTMAPLPGVYLIFSVQRRLGIGPVTARERRIAAILRDHLIRSTRLRHRLEHMNRLSRAVIEKLEQAPNGMAILNPEGTVIFSNDILMSFAERGISIRNRRLVATRQVNQKRLDELLDACREPEGAGAAIRQHVTTLVVEGELPLIARATRFLAHDSEAASLFRDLRDFVLLTIIDPSTQRTQQPLEELRALGLSMQEARLAALIAIGQSPAEAAIELNISVATCRTYLKTVFEKLGVNSQSQLSALAARLR